MIFINKYKGFKGTHPDCGSGGRRFETDLPPHKDKGLQQCGPFFVSSLAHYLHTSPIKE